MNDVINWLLYVEKSIIYTPVGPGAPAAPAAPGVPGMPGTPGVPGIPTPVGPVVCSEVKINITYFLKI